MESQLALCSNLISVESGLSTETADREFTH